MSVASKAFEELSILSELLQRELIFITGNNRNLLSEFLFKNTWNSIIMGMVDKILGYMQDLYTDL